MVDMLIQLVILFLERQCPFNSLFHATRDPQKRYTL